MPATPLPASTRFFQPEISKVYFLPAIAATSLTPTRAEIDAGDDLTGEIADLAGWQVRSNFIDTPDLGAKFVKQIGGRTAAAASSLTFYGDKEGIDVRQATPRGQVGFVMFCDGGDVAGQPADVFPIEVASVGKVRTVSDNAFQLTLDYAITDVPAEDITIPA